MCISRPITCRALQPLTSLGTSPLRLLLMAISKLCSLLDVHPYRMQKLGHFTDSDDTLLIVTGAVVVRQKQWQAQRDWEE